MAIVYVASAPRCKTTHSGSEASQLEITLSVTAISYLIKASVAYKLRAALLVIKLI